MIDTSFVKAHQHAHEAVGDSQDIGLSKGGEIENACLGVELLLSMLKIPNCFFPLCIFVVSLLGTFNNWQHLSGENLLSALNEITTFLKFQYTPPEGIFSQLLR